MSLNKAASSGTPAPAVSSNTPVTTNGIMDIEKLFTSSEIATLREEERKLRKDAVTSREELRTMVGEQYRYLMRNCGIIMQIRSDAFRIQEQLVSISDRFAHSTTTATGVGTGMATTSTATTDDIAAAKLREESALIAYRCRFVGATLDLVQTYLDTEQIIRAASTYQMSLSILESLERMQQQRPSVTQGAILMVSPQMLQSLRDSLQLSLQRILVKATTTLSRPDAVHTLTEGAGRGRGGLVTESSQNRLTRRTLEAWLTLGSFINSADRHGRAIVNVESFCRVLLNCRTLYFRDLAAAIIGREDTERDPGAQKEHRRPTNTKDGDLAFRQALYVLLDTYGLVQGLLDSFAAKQSLGSMWSAIWNDLAAARDPQNLSEIFPIFPDGRLLHQRLKDVNFGTSAGRSQSAPTPGSHPFFAFDQVHDTVLDAVSVDERKRITALAMTFLSQAAKQHLRRLLDSVGDLKLMRRIGSMPRPEFMAFLNDAASEIVSSTSRAVDVDDIAYKALSSEILQPMCLSAIEVSCRQLLTTAVADIDAAIVSVTSSSLTTTTSTVLLDRASVPEAARGMAQTMQKCLHTVGEQVGISRGNSSTNISGTGEASEGTADEEENILLGSSPSASNLTVSSLASGQWQGSESVIRSLVEHVVQSCVEINRAMRTRTKEASEQQKQQMEVQDNNKTNGSNGSEDVGLYLSRASAAILKHMTGLLKSIGQAFRDMDHSLLTAQATMNEEVSTTIAQIAEPWLHLQCQLVTEDLQEDYDAVAQIGEVRLARGWTHAGSKGQVLPSVASPRLLSIVREIAGTVRSSLGPELCTLMRPFLSGRVRAFLGSVLAAQAMKISAENQSLSGKDDALLQIYADLIFLDCLLLVPKDVGGGQAQSDGNAMATLQKLLSPVTLRTVDSAVRQNISRTLQSSYLLYVPLGPSDMRSLAMVTPNAMPADKSGSGSLLIPTPLPRFQNVGI
eukprot:Clim_evm10s34 gene=Clim_evmTU10s34